MLADHDVQDAPARTADSLESLLAELEAKTAPVDEHAFFEAFRDPEGRLQGLGERSKAALVSERIAFTVYADGREDGSSWGIYFGPMMTGTDAQGARWDVPELSAMTPEVLDYWGHRAKSCQHPVMRARYADLLWEMPKIIDRAKDAAMARVAIDAYAEGIENHRYDHPTVVIGRARRALSLALQIGDQPRIERVRDLLIALDDGSASDENAGLWGFAFDLFLGPDRTPVRVSDAVADQLVQGIEARLSSLARGAPSAYHPSAAEGAATRLAEYYRRRRRAADVERVLETYVEIVKRMTGVAAAMVFGHSLQQLRQLLLSYGLRAQADALEPLIRSANEGAMAEMKSVSAEVTVDSAQVEAYFSEMLSGSAEDVMTRVASHFTPRKDQLTTELLALAHDAPLAYMMPHRVVDSSGRDVAWIGSIEDDLEGQVVRHIAQHVGVAVPWLRETLGRGVQNGSLSVTSLTEFIYRSPLFAPDHRGIIECGLHAYVNGDAIAALHVLVPQVEAAIRVLSQSEGRPVYAAGRDGALELKTLHALLRDSGVEAVLGPDIANYLRILFVDPRGLNLRNDVSHGLLGAAAMSMPLADRALHALLVLALFRAAEATQVGA